MTDEPLDSGVARSGPERGRYGELALEGGYLVIYDRDSPDTYIQSDIITEVES